MLLADIIHPNENIIRKIDSDQTSDRITIQKDTEILFGMYLLQKDSSV